MRIFRVPSLKPRLFRRFGTRLALASAVAIALLAGTPRAARAGDPPPTRWDYAEMFDIVRDTMRRKPARDLLNELFKEQLQVDPKTAKRFGFTDPKIASFTETQLLMLLQEVPTIRPVIQAYLKAIPLGAEKETQTPELKALREQWREKFKQLFAADQEMLPKFLKRNDPLKPFTMELPPGQKGFPEIEEYFTHDLTIDGKLRRADDVEQAVVDFIKKAKHQIRFNVFDFDLESIANALIEAHRAGKDVMGGIDKGVIEARPEVKAIYEKLVGAGVPVQAVDSVGLNHQKLIVTDWDYPEDARTLLSEGNFTQSCLAVHGDMTGTPFRSALAVPNANSVHVVKSQTLALTVHHELTKTVDPKYAYRGRDYPLSGAYQILGEPEVDGTARWLMIAFTPNGALGDVNKNVISRVIRVKKGPKYFAQFAFASKDDEAALLQSAIESKRLGKPFEMHGVCDTPFATQKWSVCLSIAGFELRGEGDKKEFVKIADKDNAWRKALGQEGYEELLKHLRIAPPEYGTHVVKTVAGNFKLTAKLHHKIMCVGPAGDQLCIYGSFNFSEGAESNQEYIVVFKDRKTNQSLTSVVTTLEGKSEKTVVQQVLYKNRKGEFDPEIGQNVEAMKANRSTIDAKVRCKDLLKPQHLVGLVK